eukprot:3683870-Amphidinium_carterae.1
MPLLPDLWNDTSGRDAIDPQKWVDYGMAREGFLSQRPCCSQSFRTRHSRQLAATAEVFSAWSRQDQERYGRNIGTVGLAGSTILASEQSASLASALVAMPRSTRLVDRLQSQGHRLESQVHRLQRQEILNRLQRAAPTPPPTRTGPNGTDSAQADPRRQGRSGADGDLGSSPYQANYSQAAGTSAEGSAGQAYGRSQATGGESGQPDQSDRGGGRETGRLHS